MERPSEINPQKLLLMFMTSLITSQRDVKFGWIQEMDTYSAYMSESQYMQSYWFSNKSNINIIYNISVGTITIRMSVILANFGKYAISDCPFICLSVCLYGNFTKSQERLDQSSLNLVISKHQSMIPASSLDKNVGQITRSRGQKLSQILKSS